MFTFISFIGYLQSFVILFSFSDSRHFANHTFWDQSPGKLFTSIIHSHNFMFSVNTLYHFMSYSLVCFGMG